MAFLSRETAKEIIARIREDNGGISEEDRARSPEAVLRALANVRRKLSAATKLLAVNLYSSDARFVYEIVQNAEDNQYGFSTAKPYIKFRVLSDKIIIESNERGFTETDVDHICSTGESSKKDVQGYIGEKGIGFKSVFRVAKKVHIQSGPFSFSFIYTRGLNDVGDGLGMVTPMDEPYEEISPDSDVRTRMTLTLIKQPMTEECFNEWFNIPSTILLFLRKLKSIHIIREFSKDDPTSTVFERSDSVQGLVSTTATVSSTLQNTSTERHFRLKQREVHNLPPDDVRTRFQVSSAMVSLAFEVNRAGNQPVDQTQHAFAYLPMRNTGFKFLINSDFVTRADRQDIDDSRRNRALLTGVAETFLDAVVGFCQGTSLEYNWLTYVPGDHVGDGAWRHLRERIIRLLVDSSIIRCSDGVLRPPMRVLLPVSPLTDASGKPLLEDSQQDLSLHYGKQATSRIRMLGARNLHWSAFLERLDRDLSSARSHVKLLLNGLTWHDQIAQVLSSQFGGSSPSQETLSIQRRLKEMKLVKLRDATWIPVNSGKTYFPQIGSSSVPHDLGLRLVDQSAIQLNSWKRLYEVLGVTQCEPEEVTKLIFAKYRQGSINVTYAGVQTHLYFLFECSPHEPQDIRASMKLPDEGGKLRRLELSNSGLGNHRLYFRDILQTYGPGALLAGQCSLFAPTTPMPKELDNDGIHFIHESCTKYTPSGGHTQADYLHWLLDIVGVLKIVPLEHHREHDLSVEFAYIIQHSPEKLVGTLKHHWPVYSPVVSSNNDIREALRNSNVPVENCDQLAKLRDTYLPLPSLKNIASGAKVDPGALFLKIPRQISGADLESWRFLEEFGVGLRDDARFYLRLLRRLAAMSHEASEWNSIYSVYEKLSIRCYVEGDVELIRNNFDNDHLVCVPHAKNASSVVWVANNECVWSGPAWLTVKNRLDGKYGPMELLFHKHLRIPISNWRDCLDEIEHRKKQGSVTLKEVAQIYRHLMHDFTHHESWDELRSQFEQRDLVFSPERNSWHASSSCIWAEGTVYIHGKQAIATAYSDLQDFFVRMLAIPRPDLLMYVQALTQLANETRKDGAWQGRVKDAMLLISSMDPKSGDLNTLRPVNVFPVRNGTGDVQPTSSRVEFAIVDKAEYIELFPSLHTLDFTLEEVHRYGKFLKAMNLGKKYLSVLVQEKTHVTGGLLDPTLTEFLSIRAYALFRCAVFYHSTKARMNDLTLFGQLRTSQTFTSEGLAKSLTVVQNSVEHKAERRKANIHLDDADAALKLYVPKSKSDRELCYLRQLPRRLMRFLDISDPAAEAVISSILNSSSLTTVDGILEDAGIIEVAGITRPTEAESNHLEDVESEEYSERTPESTVSEQSNDAASPNSSVTGSSEHTSSPSGYVEARQVPLRQTNLQTTPVIDASSHLPVSPTLPGSAPDVTTPEPSGYATLLRRMIAASNEATLPSADASGVFDSWRGDHTAFPDPMFAYRSADRDKKVGAAGELFVYNLLAGIGLPGFGKDNWPSTMRNQVVNVLDEYKDFGEWHRKETGDLVYNDSEGKLIELLGRKGYLHSHGVVAGGHRAECCIEVKTTTRDCSEPLFVSDRQYKMMEEQRISSPESVEKLYILMRVFNIEQRYVGLKVFLDPMAAKDQGELTFTSKWKVRTNT